MLPLVIVDDSQEDSLLAQRVIMQCGIRNPVVPLRSGAACIDYFRGAAPHENRAVPCLLMLDMIMGAVSGLDVLRSVREIPAVRGSLIVMLSGMADLKTIHQGYQLGANTFLVKPLSAEDLMQMLRAVRAVTVNNLPQGFELALTSSGLPAVNDSRAPMFPNLFQ
jgi:CheY-like chemotaxis protein